MPVGSKRWCVMRCLPHHYRRKTGLGAKPGGLTASRGSCMGCDTTKKKMQEGLTAIEAAHVRLVANGGDPAATVSSPVVRLRLVEVELETSELFAEAVVVVELWWQSRRGRAMWESIVSRSLSWRGNRLQVKKEVTVEGAIFCFQISRMWLEGVSSCLFCFQSRHFPFSHFLLFGALTW